MGRRLLIILVLLLMVRPIVLVENSACDKKTAVPTLPPGKEVPCSDFVQPTEIVNNGHHCPCFAMMQPEPAGINASINDYTLFTTLLLSAETAVATPPTPPPRFV